MHARLFSSADLSRLGRNGSSNPAIILRFEQRVSDAGQLCQLDREQKFLSVFAEEHGRKPVEASSRGHGFLESQSGKARVRDGCFLLTLYSDSDNRGQNFKVGGDSYFIFSWWLNGAALVLVRDFAQGGV